MNWNSKGKLLVQIITAIIIIIAAILGYIYESKIAIIVIFGAAVACTVCFIVFHAMDKKK